MSIPDLERFTLDLGARGDDPFIAPILGHALGGERQARHVDLALAETGGV